MHVSHYAFIPLMYTIDLFKHVFANKFCIKSLFYGKHLFPFYKNRKSRKEQPYLSTFFSSKAVQTIQWIGSVHIVGS